MRAHILAEWEEKQTHSGASEIKPLRVASTASALNLAAAAIGNVKDAPRQSLPFQAFPRVEIKWDKDYLFIGSNGMPDHGMMVGITAWQQQVPLPQAYFGNNAWRLPLYPVPAKEPALIKGRFLRGAIALAVNGIPIFNPQNNRGDISQEIGELDQWGGHCGRADDYHYHAAPLHLQAIVGKGMPIAYGLDGYPVYGLTEPDGSPVSGLDVCHGHETPGVGYHYHASTKYPYVLGGFHGVVVESEGQVDPQPRAQGVRPDTPPLRGAEITGFESTGDNSYRLTYTINNAQRSVAYTIKTDGTYPFEYDNGSEGVTKEVYTARPGGGGKGGPRGAGEPKGRGKQARKQEPPPSPAPAGSRMDSNGDGHVSAQEFAESARHDFGMRKDGSSLSDTMEKARATFLAMDSNQDGKLSPDELSAPEVKTPTATNAFVLTSPEVKDGGNLPVDYTGDGTGATLPLSWKGAPAGTKSYALIMDHLAPGNEMKGYWTMWDIPANVTNLPKNVKSIGQVGTGFRGQVGYEPPHSKGPGAKTYVLHVYALSATPEIDQPASQVNREVLLAAIQDRILATADLHVVYSRGDSAGPPPRPRPGGQGDRED